MHIFWVEKISNELFELTEQEGIVLTRRRCTWIGQDMFSIENFLTFQKLPSDGQGKEKEKRPQKSTWRRTAEAELHSLNLNWGQTSQLPLDQQE